MFYGPCKNSVMLKERYIIALSGALIKESEILLDNKIDEGSSNKVWKGRWITYDYKTVAIKKKCLPQTKEHDINEHMLVLREMYSLKKINHKNIIKLIGVYATDNDYNILMEYFKGEPIHKINFKSGIIFGSKRAKVLKRKDLVSHQIGNAMKYLHDNEIAHGDINQDNILVDSNFNVKLIDFNHSFTKKDCSINIIVNEIGNDDDYHNAIMSDLSRTTDFLIDLYTSTLFTAQFTKSNVDIDFKNEIQNACFVHASKKLSSIFKAKLVKIKE